MNMGHRLPEILEEVGQGARGSGLPDPRQPLRAVRRHAGRAERDPGRALQDDSGRSAQVREGYYGRLAARRPANFSARANVEPEALAHERAGLHVEPWVPRLRRELGAGVDDEDLLLAAFYDKELLAPLRKREA